MDRTLHIPTDLAACQAFEFVMLRRPAVDTLDTTKQQQMASAIARALVETESSLAEPRFQLRRITGKTLIACTRDRLAESGLDAVESPE